MSNLQIIQPYSNAYIPSMPILDISISMPDAGNWLVMQPAVVDSGADFTIVPLPLLKTLQAPVIRSAILSSHAKDRRSIYVYEVDILLGELILPYIEVAGDPQRNEILLGRNILNLLDMRLEGPAQQLHVSISTK